jgi:excisionase family DNA binding protein
MTCDFPGSQPEMLRVHIVARRLGRSDRTIRRLIQHGELPAQRLGQRAWGVLSIDVDNLRSRMVGE